MAFCFEVSLGNFEIQILLQLYDSIFLGKLLFNFQSWSRMTRKHYDELQQVQLRMLKQIMKVPYTTPTAGIFQEFGQSHFVMIFSLPQKILKSHEPFLDGAVSHPKNNLVRTNKRTPVRRKHIHHNM